MAVYGWDGDTLLDEYLAYSARGEHFAILDHGEPEALLAFADEGGAVFTFLVGAEGFFEHSLARRHEFRRFMHDCAAEYGDTFTLSRSPDPNLPRWFKAMGAICLGEHKGDKVFLWA